MHDDDIVAAPVEGDHPDAVETVPVDPDAEALDDGTGEEDIDVHAELDDDLDALAAPDPGDEVLDDGVHA